MCTVVHSSIRMPRMLFFYPRESFREGLWNHRRTFVCLSVCLLPRLLNKTWTDLDEIFWEGSQGKKQAQVRLRLRSLAKKR